MATIYNMCKKLIEADKKNGTSKMTQQKLDIYLANDRLTVEEYDELCELMNA